MVERGEVHRRKLSMMEGERGEWREGDRDRVVDMFLDGWSDRGGSFHRQSITM